MDLVNSIAQMSMSMSTAKFQQDLHTLMLKKAIDGNSDMMNGILQMIDAVPKFSGEKGSILDVRA